MGWVLSPLGILTTAHTMARIMMAATTTRLAPMAEKVMAVTSRPDRKAVTTVVSRQINADKVLLFPL